MSSSFEIVPCNFLSQLTWSLTRCYLGSNNNRYRYIILATISKHLWTQSLSRAHIIDAYLHLYSWMCGLSTRVILPTRRSRLKPDHIALLRQVLRMFLTFFKEILRASLWSDDTIDFPIKEAVRSERNESTEWIVDKERKKRIDRQDREREETYHIILIKLINRNYGRWKFHPLLLYLSVDGEKTCQLIINRISPGATIDDKSSSLPFI